MITISEIAKKHFLKLLKKQTKGTQIRIFVANPGTVNAECGVSYCPPDAITISDKALNFGELILYVDQSSAPYLKGTEIDFVKDHLGNQLTVKSPNIKVAQIKKDASLSERIEYILQQRINPQLANHGGHVSLVRVTKEKLAVLKFSGGCNGCSMVNVTLKGGIEKCLLEELPDLKGIRDVTEHQRGQHSYFK